MKYKWIWIMIAGLVSVGLGITSEIVASDTGLVWYSGWLGGCAVMGILTYKKSS